MMMRIDINSVIYLPNKKVTKVEIRKIFDKYTKVFQEIECIMDKKEKQKLHAQFRMKLVLLAQKPRHVPYYLQETLKEWLLLGIE